MLLTISTGMDNYLQFITVLLLFVFVLVITWLTTRWIARFQKVKTGVGNLEVIETLKVAQNKYVQIVRAGEKYLVIAIGKDEVHMLAEISGGELVMKEEAESPSMDFSQILERVKKRKDKEKD